MRWRRAMRLLEAPAGARVLDLGCAFGFGTRMLTRKFACTGLDGSPSFVAQATRAVRQARFAQGVAERLPFRDGSFDAVICHEVLEHLASEPPAIAEIARVLKSGGELVLSVPHAGALERWDSLNVYLRATGRQLTFPIGEVPGGSVWHRHYTVEVVQKLLHGFAIDRIQLTGTGLAELANLGLLAICRGNMRLYERLQAIYFALAVAEDDLPLGRRAYNVMIHARKVA
jgi:ubiquinone/menaquinone biosynthesis C-methylase UbiE